MTYFIISMVSLGMILILSYNILNIYYLRLLGYYDKKEALKYASVSLTGLLIFISIIIIIMNLGL